MDASAIKGLGFALQALTCRALVFIRDGGVGPHGLRRHRVLC